jgi:energy-coupling factor transporter transmembrane protein EcfT
VPRRAFSRAPLLPGRGPLARVPPAAAFLVVIVLFALGVWLRGPLGAGLLGLLALGLLALLGSTWRLLSTGQRVARVFVVVLLVVVAVSVLR